MMVSETAIEHLAAVCRVDVQLIRERNLYKQGDLTHFGQPLEEYSVPAAWNNLMTVTITYFICSKKDLVNIAYFVIDC